MARANLGQEHGQKAQQWLCVGNQWTRNWYLGTQTQPSQYLQDHFSHFGKITTSNTKCVADQWGTATLCSPQRVTCYQELQRLLLPASQTTGQRQSWTPEDGLFPLKNCTTKIFQLWPELCQLHAHSSPSQGHDSLERTELSATVLNHPLP